MVQPPCQTDDDRLVPTNAACDPADDVARVPAAFMAKQMADDEPISRELLCFGNDSAAHDKPKRVIDSVDDGVSELPFAAEEDQSTLE